MTPIEPFAYPLTPHAPTHAPDGYSDYASYKPWLRDDFAFRCVYCLSRERWYPSGHAGFGVDHVIAQVAAPDLVAAYGNLVYSCNVCNSSKGGGPLPLDPLSEAVGVHVGVGPDGVAVAFSPAGEDWITMFGLNSRGLVESRRDKLASLRAKYAHPADPDIDRLYRRAFGYPDDLPDLAALKPPGGNARAGSESLSHFARRRRGELADVY